MGDLISHGYGLGSTSDNGTDGWVSPGPLQPKGNGKVTYNAPHISEVEELNALLRQIKNDRLAGEIAAEVKALLDHHTQSVLDELEARLPENMPAIVMGGQDYANHEAAIRGYTYARNQVREAIENMKVGKYGS